MSNFITTKDGVDIFYKDWGSKDAQPIMFHHGWPLSSDDWDAQMLFFLSKGYRVVAHDRRGHGRSAQVDVGHDMAHYAADAAAVAAHLDLRRTAVAATVMRDDAIALRQEEQHLRVPVVGGEGPAMVEHDRLGVLRAPVLVEDVDAVAGRYEVRHGTVLCSRVATGSSGVPPL